MKQIIDLSKHNGTIDFAKVKASGINDVILQVGWIGNYNNHTLDLKFEEYYSQAKYYGLNIGIYVYNYCKRLDTLNSGLQWVKEKLENKEINLGLFLDMEDNSILSCGKDLLTNMCIMFCSFFNSLGYTSGIYANKNWFTNYLKLLELLNYKIWWAEYNGKDKPTNNFKIDLWQYTSSGKVPGITGNVDISYCMCDCEENSKPKENKQNIGDGEEVKSYVNGSTIEKVYSDTNLSNKIGSLNPYEQCDCFGIFQNRAMVRYKVDNKQNYKIGFVKWLGGVK